MGGDPKRGREGVTKERTQGKASLTQPLAPLCPLAPTTGSMPITVHTFRGICEGGESLRTAGRTGSCSLAELGWVIRERARWCPVSRRACCAETGSQDSGASTVRAGQLDEVVLM